MGLAVAQLARAGGPEVIGTAGGTERDVVTGTGAAFVDHRAPGAIDRLRAFAPAASTASWTSWAARRCATGKTVLDLSARGQRGQ